VNAEQGSCVEVRNFGQLAVTGNVGQTGAALLNLLVSDEPFFYIL
jgi:hypothetical protein